MNSRPEIALDCYHCGLPVPAGADFVVAIDGAPRAMCCPGCQAVASAIVDGGLDRFYRYRGALSPTPPAAATESLASYDLPEVQRDFVRAAPDGSHSAELLVSGITCSACAWLIEHHLARVPGVEAVSVNASTHRCLLRWRPEAVAPSRLLAAFEAIGYEARPAGDEGAERKRGREAKLFLLRLGVAGLGMMQAGHAAIGLYAGAYTGIDPEWEALLRWVSLVTVTPVVLFSAQPFFAAAWRSLRARHLVMDVPVALAVALAFVASAWATVTHSGEVYYDSVSMFVFLLLLGRYLEMRVRHRNEHYSASLARLIPPVATRLDQGGEQAVAVKSLLPGDLIRVASGATIPCDGVVEAGQGAVIEAVLTGEQNPVVKGPGSAVSAGTVNGDNPLRIRVASTGQHTRLGAILDLVASAQGEKPRIATQADRVASGFVAAVLVVAVAVAAIWWWIDPARALWVTLSVLVVTCPCALSLATPTALTVASAELRRRGFLIRRGHVLETLAVVDRCVFDKTGTLTLGAMGVSGVLPLADLAPEELLALAAALERGSSHPIARAFAGVPAVPPVEDQASVLGQGVAGTVAGRRLAFGTPEFAAGRFGFPAPAVPAGAGLPLLLADEGGPLGWIVLEDTLRPGAADAIRQLEAAGVAVELLSGDRPAAAAAMADRLAIRQWRGGASPEDKLAHIRRRQGEGHRVLMVGDGINDVPVLSGADVSVAMGDAVDVTRLHADSLLVSGNLDTLAAAVVLARRTRAIIRQNLGWALLYNLLALPLAAAGMIPPWVAAIGMSLSSLLVVVNALRLGRRGGGR
ncbi:MAG: heavy metal translocating P-type ATPase [Porticoccaceae bacterium]|jgi:Cu2+-exporting ATPase|nr:heavy metal translocating P-type ATPase [Porticoccaceae bacterium]